MYDLQSQCQANYFVDDEDRAGFLDTMLGDGSGILLILQLDVDYFLSLSLFGPRTYIVLSQVFPGTSLSQ